jgi:hypothetical protein
VDAFSEALALVDDGVPAEEAATILVGATGASVERLLDAEHRARALERELPGDARARRIHDVVQQAAQLAVRTPSDVPPSTGLADRLAGSRHDVDADQLAADLDRLRGPVVG